MHRIKIMEMPYTMALQPVVRHVYYATYSHICKFCTHYKNSRFRQSGTPLIVIFPHATCKTAHSNRCGPLSKKIGDLCSNPFCLRGDYLFSQISLLYKKSNLPMCLFLSNFISKTNNITTLTI